MTVNTYWPRGFCRNDCLRPAICYGSEYWNIPANKRCTNVSLVNKLIKWLLPFPGTEENIHPVWQNFFSQKQRAVSEPTPRVRSASLLYKGQSCQPPPAGRFVSLYPSALQREGSHGLLSVDVNKWAWLPSNLTYTQGNLNSMIFMCLTKLISMRRLSQPFKDSLPIGHGLPTGEEKGGFRLKQGYTDLIYLFPDFFSCASL